MNEKRWLLKSIYVNLQKRNAYQNQFYVNLQKEMHTKINFFFQSVTSTGTIYNSTDKNFCSNDHPFVNYNPITTTKFFSTVQHYIHDEKNLSNITY
jgi:hypothetical protein